MNENIWGLAVGSSLKHLDANFKHPKKINDDILQQHFIG